MKPELTHHEILLAIRSWFFSRPFCSKDGSQIKGIPFSSMEELEKACWNGILDEALPELFEESGSSGDKQIRSTASGMNFLCVNISQYPVAVEKQASIDPYIFLHQSCQLN